MELKLQGSITRINAHMSAMGDVVQALTIEVHGDFAAMRELMEQPLLITLNPCGNAAIVSEEELHALSAG
jgi:hypothetical protein